MFRKALSISLLSLAFPTALAAVMLICGWYFDRLAVQAPPPPTMAAAPAPRGELFAWLGHTLNAGGLHEKGRSR